VIPKAVRDQAQLHPGDEVDIAFDEDRIVIVARRHAGVLGGRFAQSGMADRLLEIAVANRDERLPGLVGDPGLA
jgi:AbrB family looped-hinge helix DNA binding protein